MRKLLIKSENTNIEVTTWDIYLNHRSLNDIIRENIDAGNFHGKVTVIIEEIEPLTIESNKQPEIVDEEVDVDGVPLDVDDTF